MLSDAPTVSPLSTHSCQPRRSKARFSLVCLPACLWVSRAPVAVGSSFDRTHQRACQSASRNHRCIFVSLLGLHRSEAVSQSVRVSSRSSQDAFYDRQSVCRSVHAKDGKILDSSSAIETRYQSVPTYRLKSAVCVYPPGALVSARERGLCCVSGGRKKKNHLAWWKQGRKNIINYFVWCHTGSVCQCGRGQSGRRRRRLERVYRPRIVSPKIPWSGYRCWFFHSNA